MSSSCPREKDATGRDGTILRVTADTFVKGRTVRPFVRAKRRGPEARIDSTFVAIPRILHSAESRRLAMLLLVAMFLRLLLLASVSNSPPTHTSPSSVSPAQKFSPAAQLLNDKLSGTARFEAGPKVMKRCVAASTKQHPVWDIDMHTVMDLSFGSGTINSIRCCRTQISPSNTFCNDDGDEDRFDSPAAGDAGVMRHLVVGPRRDCSGVLSNAERRGGAGGLVVAALKYPPTQAAGCVRVD